MRKLNFLPLKLQQNRGCFLFFFNAGYLLFVFECFYWLDCQIDSVTVRGSSVTHIIDTFESQ